MMSTLSASAVILVKPRYRVAWDRKCLTLSCLLLKNSGRSILTLGLDGMPPGVCIDANWASNCMIFSTIYAAVGVEEVPDLVNIIIDTNLTSREGGYSITVSPLPMSNTLPKQCNT